MSILGYAGLPGSGKSYGVIENVVIPALKDGRTIVHNLMLKETELRIATDGKGKLIQIPKGADANDVCKLAEPGCVLILDEVWNYWPAGTKANEIPKHQLSLFKEHRHRVGDDGKAMEIIIIDQDLGSGVARFIRDLVEATYVHTKHASLGLRKMYRVDIYSRAQAASKPAKSALIRKMQGKYKPEIFNCYVSQTQSKQLGEAGLEVIPDDRANLWKSTTVRASFLAVACVPLVIWWLSSAWDGMADNMQKKKPAPTSVQARAVPDAALSSQPVAAPPVAAEPESTAAPVESGPAVSRTWRVLGVITLLDGRGQAYISSSTGRRVLDISRCEQDPDSNWFCHVEDGIATVWSGARDALSARQPDGMLAAGSQAAETFE